jgi:hypothetical protein
MRAPFLFEPVISISFPPNISILISPINVGLMIILMILIYFNFSILFISIFKPKHCQIKRKSGRIITILPAFLTGFACCVPTFIIAWVGVLGTFSSTVILFTRWAIPISIILLIYGISEGLKKITI